MQGSDPLQNIVYRAALTRGVHHQKIVGLKLRAQSSCPMSIHSLICTGLEIGPHATNMEEVMEGQTGRLQLKHLVFHRYKR